MNKIIHKPKPEKDNPTIPRNEKALTFYSSKLYIYRTSVVWPDW